ncbi:bifunctional glutamate N-acetyltransferase/amino-acid acetyltransferase ArgJ [Thiomicrorhabdus xiamenensis]|uniref:Arginine biosynthesis bifunctional protein ArgJ n=1 Tax=Thiomicrorhabdus xiamenensis TaxID=2739063 RepID=A0A7D4SY35_9GAMM|nr:bifunctional glutamate N-acetyltransferase/amino-acid acetyltransferase ArgJ [Thiomicrorhabdus xiamenensis]QKI88724.1 bifunctional glutamate N-acetyltransferase/amino-acid acetyltransferase ArgJ [Thiomicrorhabdus xiamenensis]
MSSQQVLNIHPVAGVYLGTTAAKIKKNGKSDLVVIELCKGALTAATFTQNAFCAAPVTVAKENLAKHAPRALVINAGNANAGTGEQGMNDAVETCALVAKELGCSPEEVLPFSTGVIGENLPMEKFAAGIPDAMANLSIDGWKEAGHAIMTTDLVSKMVSRVIDINGASVTLTGMAKGSGMIHPNMATMLGFVATDAKISQECLQKALTDAVNVSFNRITVDGDTSTNDACTLSATQQADMEEITDSNTLNYHVFAEAVSEMMTELAQMIVRDGEGATKFVSVIVEEAKTQEEALKVAHAVALSPLVKTALFASDPNWGRILAAVGRAGVEDLDINALEIYLGDVCIVRNGGRAEEYTEAQGQAVMDKTDIDITIWLNRGPVYETVWTTDFSYDYVKINAEYRS